MRLRSFTVVLVAGTVGALSSQAPAAAQEDFQGFAEWAAPVNLSCPPVPPSETPCNTVNTAAEESAPAISDDGLSLYFNRNPNLPGSNEDLYVSRRARPAKPPRKPTFAWGPPVPLGTVNTSTANERNATLSRDGRLLFFSSDRPDGFGALDLYLSRRTDRNDDQAWSTPVNLGPAVNSAAGDVGPDYVEDEAGRTVLYFTSTRPAPPGFGAADIYKTTLGADGSFGAAVLVPELSSPSGDARPAIRTDGLELVLHSNRPGPPLSCPADSPTPSGGQDLWVSTRSTVAEPWSCPVNLGSAVNSASNDLQAALSDDAETLFFSANRPGGLGSDDIWTSKREKQ